MEGGNILLWSFRLRPAIPFDICCWWLVFFLSLISFSFASRTEPDNDQKETAESWLWPPAAEFRLHPGGMHRDLVAIDFCYIFFCVCSFEIVTGGWWGPGRGTPRLTPENVFGIQHRTIFTEYGTFSISEFPRRLQSPHALQSQLQ